MRVHSTDFHACVMLLKRIFKVVKNKKKKLYIKTFACIYSYEQLKSLMKITKTQLNRFRTTFESQSCKVTVANEELRIK